MGLVAAVVVVVLSAAPSAQFTWTVTSGNGSATLTQTALPDDACSLRCELKGKPAWTQQTCLGRNTDFAFVSEDCATSLLLFEYPLRAATTQETPIAVVLKADGGLTQLKLGQLLDVSRLRGEGRRVRWLAGVVGEPGVKPHLNSAGTALEFATLDGADCTVRFDKPEDFFAPGVSAAPARGSDQPDGMYQYVGEDGSTQFVMGLSLVPPRFRKRATRVESDVSTVKGTKMPYKPPSYDYGYGTYRPPPAPVAKQPATGTGETVVYPGGSAVDACPFGVNVFGGCGGGRSLPSGPPPSLGPPQRPAGW